MMANKLTALAGSLMMLASAACAGDDFSVVPGTLVDTGTTGSSVTSSTASGTTGTMPMNGFACKGTLDPAWVEVEPMTSWSWSVDTVAKQACAAIDGQTACMPCDLAYANDVPQCKVTLVGPDKQPMTVSFDPINDSMYIFGGTDLYKAWTPQCQ